MSYDNIIGKGPSFPIVLTDGQWKNEEDAMALLKSDLKSHLVYQVGTRLRQEDFGNRLEECLEEPNTNILVRSVTNFILESLNGWDSRIDRMGPEHIKVIPGQASIQVELTIPLTNSVVVSELFTVNL